MIFATTSAGAPFALIAKYSPGCSTHAAIIAISATIISVDHRAIADVADARFAREHLRRRAGGDERMKPGDRAARDRDANEWKNRPAKTGPVPSMKREIDGISSVGRSDYDRDAKCGDGSQFQETC